MALPTYTEFNTYMSVTRKSGRINMFDAPPLLKKRFKGLTQLQAEGLTTIWIFDRMDYESFNHILFKLEQPPCTHSESKTHH